MRGPPIDAVRFAENLKHSPRPLARPRCNQKADVMGRWVSSPAYRAAVPLLTAARKAAGLTQRELAKRIGRPHSVIARALDLGDAEMMACAGAAIGGDLEL